MKIAIVSPYSWAHPGGVNNHVGGLGRELAARGHQVTIVAPDGGAVVEGVEFVSAGRSVPVPANGSIARLGLLPGAGRRVLRAIRGASFDVVHVHEPLLPLVSTAAVLAADCPVVGTFHAAGEGRSLAYLAGKTFLGRLPGRLQTRVAVSEPARALASRYLPGDYRIVPNGVDTSRFSPGAAIARDAGTPEILFVGRNEKRKGLGVLLDAFGAVCRRVEGCTLKVIGSGFDEGEVRKALPAALRGRVSVPGFVDNEDLPAQYASADVFCAPALGGESFGIVLAESIASGTPVVASDIPGYSAVVEQTGGGLLFRKGDPGDLARALIEVLTEEGLRDSIAAKGLIGVQSFSWENVAGRLLEIYGA